MQFQVIVGSFIAEGKKSSSNLLRSGPSSPPPSQMLNFGAPMTAASPSSQGGGSTESSDENGSSPLNRGPVIYNNPSQPIHNMQMYQLWAGQTQQWRSCFSVSLVQRIGVLTSLFFLVDIGVRIQMLTCISQNNSGVFIVVLLGWIFLSFSQGSLTFFLLTIWLLKPGYVDSW